MTARQSGAIKPTTQGTIDWPASNRNAGRNEIGTGGRLRFGINGRLHRNTQLVIAQEIKRYAADKGTNAQTLAVNWVLNNRFITAVIAGPRTEAQWQDYVAALAYTFTAEDEALFDRLVVAGHPSTPGYNDPAYPLEGRPVHAG